MPEDIDLMRLKAEIFDLQVLYAKVKSDLERKLKELNERTKDEK